MSIYLDANALIRFYLELPGSHEIQKELGATVRMESMVPVTELLKYEVTNGIHRMVFESRQGGQWRVTPETALCALSDFAEDLADQIFIQRSSISLTDIEAEFSSLVSRHTAREGFRTYDILHVASALRLGSKKFISFDAKAVKLAKLVGLKTN